jgi:hypothetical protein
VKAAQVSTPGWNVSVLVLFWGWNLPRLGRNLIVRSLTSTDSTLPITSSSQTLLSISCPPKQLHWDCTIYPSHTRVLVEWKQRPHKCERPSADPSSNLINPTLFN